MIMIYVTYCDLDKADLIGIKKKVFDQISVAAKAVVL